ncbi:MAG: uroporphyrinogen-III C-methyltransferase [Chloroflexi bacterium]|nr:uroporphyrinogen-III C-methyltransferase [Chloroflexota bacterium]
MSSGWVYLVGAGPGDPGLITVKGLRLLRRAHVVVYDRLIPFELLEETRPDAELIDAGKQPTRHRLAQEEINAILLDRALQGCDVVRLKGGDPLVFGRGGEEALVCRQHGIPFEIVPGVSSINAVPAYAGIPLTHRHVSSSFTVITGHEDPTKPESSINYRALAQLGGAIVIMMGVKRLSEITRQLQKHGMDGEIPAAVIEWGATQRQRTRIGTLDTIAGIARAHDIQPPAITIVGDVVRLRQAGVAWFDLLPEDVIMAM